eukprot:6202985-Prymnesium_polylepis.1
MKLTASKARHHELAIQVVQLENRLDHIAAARAEDERLRYEAERSAGETSCLLHDAVTRADASELALHVIRDAFDGPSREVNDLTDSLDALRGDMRDLEVAHLATEKELAEARQLIASLRTQLQEQQVQLAAAVADSSAGRAALHRVTTSVPGPPSAIQLVRDLR